MQATPVGEVWRRKPRLSKGLRKKKLSRFSSDCARLAGVGQSLARTIPAHTEKCKMKIWPQHTGPHPVQNMSLSPPPCRKVGKWARPANEHTCPHLEVSSSFLNAPSSFPARASCPFAGRVGGNGSKRKSLCPLDRS